MASRKLGKKLREEILENFALRVIDERITPIQKEISELVKAKYLSDIGSLGASLMADITVRPFLYTVSSILVRLKWDNQVQHMTDVHSTLVNLRWEQRPMWGEWSFDAEELGLVCIFGQFSRISLPDEWLPSTKMLQQAYKQISDDLFVMDAFIASFTTVDKLLEAAPQLMDCVPEAERPFMPLISDETVKRAQYILASFGGGK